MQQRIAAILGLIAFATCLVIGGFEAGNSFTTIVLRALVAMAVTVVVGLILGAMAERMLDENMKPQEEKMKKELSEGQGNDR